MWTIYIIYIHFTLSLQKPCFFAAQQSLAHHGWWCHSNWRRMGQAQQWAFGSPAFASLFCTAGRPAWKISTENCSGIFCLPCTSRRKLDFKRKRCLEWKMSWSCMAIEGAVVVFSRLLLCRVSKHSTISVDFQYPLVSAGPSCSRFKYRRVAALMLPKYAKIVSLTRFLFGLWFVQLCPLYKIEVWPNINQTDSRDGFIQLTKVSCINLIQSHCFESYTK